MKLVSKFDALMETIGPRLDADTRSRAALSFFNANVKERRRRLQWLMRLTHEYDRVLTIDAFGTGLMVADMERVVDGDFITLAKDAKFWLYEDEHEEARTRYAPLHAPWKKLIDEYVAESEAILGGLGDA